MGDGASATVLFPGTTAALPVYTVKVHAKFPQETPAIRGVLCLHATDSGALLAVMDSTHLTAVRTGLSGAIAADALARTDADRVAIIGAGVQGRQQFSSLAQLRTLTGASVYDVVPERSLDLTRTMGAELGIRVEARPSVAAAIEDAPIVMAATWAREPIISGDLLVPGAHVTTLGPDEPGKIEVAADVIRSALFVCDDRELAVEMGALSSSGLGAEDVDAELGEVLGGSHPGRTSDEQVTVYGGVGLAFQDAIAAWTVYERARAEGVGRAIDFLS